MAERFASVSEDESCEKCIRNQLLNSVLARYHELSNCLLICTMFTCFYLLRDNNITINVHQTRVQCRFYFVNSSNVYEHVFISISTAGSLYISHGKDCWQNIWRPWHHIRTERYDICPKTSSRKMVLKKK